MRRGWGWGGSGGGSGGGGGVAYKDLKLLEVERVNLLTRGKESLESKN